MKMFLEDYQDRNGPIANYLANERKYQTAWDTENQPILLHESFLDAAKLLLHDVHLVPDPSAELCHAISYGIVLGRIERVAFPQAIIANIAYFFNRLHIFVQQVPHMLMSVKHLVIRDEVGDVEKFSGGTVCKIGTDDEECIMEISDILQVGLIDGKYFNFVNGKYYIPTLANGNIIKHPWTQTPQLIGKNYVRDSVQPSSRIKQDVIMYPDPSE